MLTLLHFLLPALYALPFLLTHRNLLFSGQFLIGVYLGFGLLFLDRLLHVFFIQADSEMSANIKNAWSNKQILALARLIFSAGGQQERLITRSVFFLIAYVAAALFIITSTGSTIGMGMILGVGLHYVFDFYLYQRQNLEFLHQHFLWQFKRQLVQREVTSFFIVICLFFLLLTLLALVGS